MSNLTKNIIYNLFGYISIAITGFVSVRYIFRDLGEDVLGIIYFTSMLNALFLMLMDLGISATTMREVSVHYKEKPNYISQLIRTISLFYWAAFALFGILLYFMTPFIVRHWINLSSMDLADAIYIIRILSVTSLFALPQSLYASIFKGLQRMEYNNIINVVFTVIRQFGTIVILGLGGSLHHVIYLHAACYSFPVFAFIIFAVQYFPKQAFLPAFFSKVIKQNFGFISKLTLQTIVLAIYQQLDRLIISKFLPIGVLGFYSFAYSNVQRAAILQHSVDVAAFPSFSAVYGRKEPKDLISLYRQLQDLICFGNVPVLALVLFILLPLFSYLFNSEIAQIMYLPTVLLCFGAYLSGTIRLPHTLAMAIGKPEINVKKDFYSLLIVLPLTVILVYRFGLIGAGIAFILRFLFAYIYAVPKYCSQCLKMSSIEWYWHIVKILVLTTLTYGVAWFGLTIVKDFSIILIIVAYFSATIIFLIVSFLLIGEELRDVILFRFQILKTKIMEAT